MNRPPFASPGRGDRHGAEGATDPERRLSRDAPSQEKTGRTGSLDEAFRPGAGWSCRRSGPPLVAQENNVGASALARAPASMHHRSSSALPLPHERELTPRAVEGTRAYIKSFAINNLPVYLPASPQLPRILGQ